MMTHIKKVFINYLKMPKFIKLDLRFVYSNSLTMI